MVSLCVLIIAHRITAHSMNRKSKERRKIISDYIFQLLQERKLPGDLPYPGKKKWKRELLKVLEGFDLKIKEELWEGIKKEMSSLYLIYFARKWQSKGAWRKRSFSARVFAIAPFVEDEEIMVKMMNDPEFIVKNPASLAAIRLGSERGIHKALYAIAHEEGYIHFFYQDLLLQNPSSVFEKVLEFAKDPSLMSACLQVLSTTTWSKPIPFLKDTLESPDPFIRSLAYKILLRNEIQDRLAFFEKGLSDADEGVKTASLEGITYYPMEPYFGKLTESLKDSSWPIRYAAAKALKKAGEEGMKILNSQKEGLSFQAAQYVQVFD